MNLYSKMWDLLVGQPEFVDGLKHDFQHGLFILEDLHSETLQH